MAMHFRDLISFNKEKWLSFNNRHFLVSIFCFKRRCFILNVLFLSFIFAIHQRNSISLKVVKKIILNKDYNEKHDYSNYE